MSLFAGYALLCGYVFNDGHIEEYKTDYVKKDYCIQAARNSWQRFYVQGLDSQSKLTVICRNHHNGKDFVQIICDKSGGCNI